MQRRILFIQNNSNLNNIINKNDLLNIISFNKKLGINKNYII